MILTYQTTANVFNAFCSPCTAFTLGFEQMEYSFREDSRDAEVCGIIEEGGIERFFGVQLRISFIEGTATGTILIKVCY